ncbi:hypothetical protein FJT64_008000 [Amphibalanus amphitrite]|uniref:Uncharacterized protein n=1 Tax=Amphibalanus amphitrite TaxID=1232801 RepID=A0A6A4VXY0_AMPAM|nr:uncharacterized protein LOC122388962 [Amphibalanus amphitrite]KAF0294301.1 hypothetical protein FJT64_008000 [Amphibalanus amphitrite]
MAADRPRISVTAWGGGQSPPAEARLASELARLGFGGAPAAGPAAGRLQVPRAGRPPAAGPPGLWCDEAELIHSCALLSRLLGMPKSFSTGDMAQLPEEAAPRRAVSLTTLQERPELAQPALEPASRSCSTWVAVGDLGTSSQLPSPQSRQSVSHAPFSAADLVRAVNKKVRQNYIRRRLQITFRALQRLSQSELSLEQLLSGELLSLEQLLSGELPPGCCGSAAGAAPAAARDSASTAAATAVAAAAAATAAPAAAAPPRAVTVRQVDRERGQPLTRFQRNMMVFNWLQALEDDGAELTVA